MDCRALNNTLEGRRWHRFGPFNVGHKGRQVVLNEILKGFAQLTQIDRTGLHHAGRVRFLDQREQQVLKRGEFMFARVGQRQGGMD